MNDARTSYVKVEYKSGAYIAKTVEHAPPRTLVEIAAVVRHPLQGDLHHPYEADVPLFHERKASAHREKVWVPSSSVEPYEGEVPSYGESLRAAWEEMVRSMSKLAEGGEAGGGRDAARWAARSLETLRVLEKDYWGAIQ
ncbi:sporulation phosphorelay system protein KapB [Paenibacillus flagellatus]|uniref:Kinase n=1 Tax=Paenibacillus flagellatus TaxID=2211139 RepID=A0A2V5KV03_9BACL|nr:sporulation phosphorelay system protein KapB [Paenibacillus flagellatus]PYI55867.1 kinase [Paenibacillus flagellatus]